MESIVALDLETTGLDPERDAVIEIGAVRFKGDRVEAEKAWLVNPGRPLPPFVVQLTGITDDMLAAAPRLSSILDEVEAFVGDAPILGHSVRFDLSFLQRKGLFRHNPTLDTYDLASVLLPSAGRYRLASLAEILGVPLKTSHRALDDAQTTRLVYRRLHEQIDSLPLDLLTEIVRLGQEVDWGAGWAFEEALDRRPALDLRPAAPLTPPGTRDAKTPAPALAFKPREDRVALDLDELAALLEPGGPFARRFPAYENRPQQVAMLRAVADALSKGKHLLVEAGTGTGKSIAYLIPALAWAEQNGERVVISTNTINLQDQLILKDLPDLSETLGATYRGAVLKGRGNYLCPRRLAALRRLKPQSAEEMRLLAKVLVWLAQGGSGDRTQINLAGPWEAAAWARLSADNEGCSAETCLEFGGGHCPYYRARAAAEQAHVVIVNHALLLADIATGSRVLPEYNYLIVDEAHHLENAVTHGLSFHASDREIDRLLRELGSQRGGLMSEALAAAKGGLPPSLVAPLHQAAQTTAQRVQECLDGSQALFASLAAFLASQRDHPDIGPYGQQLRILPSTRTLPDWVQVEMAWENLRSPWTGAIQVVRETADLLGEAGGGFDSPTEDVATALRGAVRGLEEMFTGLEGVFFEPDAKLVYWVEARGAPVRISLHAAPLAVGPLVERFLWREKESVVMTSATLTTGGEFDYLRSRLHAQDADELALGSPFDFETSTLLYLASDIPEPSHRQAYEKAVEQALIHLCRATEGRTLALFTSYEQLKRTSRAITDPLADAGIVVLEQGEGASRHALLESFRGTERAVLLGTRSFWEGIDVPGEALSVLVIARLPFDVPSDPIIAARMETYDEPFSQYALPEAVLRFRQGFGRLIRTRSDRGVVAVFDSRILNKAYGQAFRDSLPQCTVRQGGWQSLPHAAARWLGI